MTQIGLLSDSHGRAARTAEAARLLVEAGAEVLIHLGDLGSTEVLEALAAAAGKAPGRALPVHAVLGNCDHPDSLAPRARALGISLHDPAGRLVLDGKTICFHHGHLPEAAEEALSAGADYLCHGHTHVPRDERFGRTRVVNPGALHRAASHTVALLDVAAGELRFITVAG
jgi:putative phosphoesterase